MTDVRSETASELDQKSTERASSKQPTPNSRKPRWKFRHRLLLWSFVIWVLVPSLLTAYYMFARAEDQFSSDVAFSVRSEELSPTLDLLGGLQALGGSSSSDTDVLYRFIRSQELVERLDANVDLRSIYSRGYDTDPVFAFDPNGSVEDLVDYLERMILVNYDRSTGLIEIRVKAFDSESATLIASEIKAISTEMINSLAATARDDATRYASSELAQSLERLRAARQAMTEFRSRNQIADPQTEIGVQSGLLTALQTQLSEALIELDLLTDSTRSGDPRLDQARSRVEVIQARIDEERLRFDENGTNGGLSKLIGEYESLLVDREFAEQAYLSALAAHELAQTEARRQSRYLAAYVNPTSASEARYPRRWTTLLLLAAAYLLTWVSAALVGYTLADRR
ncbi:hypothetical protein [Marivivens marinus]|uniref:hypothetical protein n=1 Tax=Marivivens marinus TaxID=3110173 RepID=UPI003B848E50